jgi:hypothetical protein
MSRSTAYRLLGRYRAQGWDGLRDRPPIARHHPRRLSVEAEMQIVELRRRTGWGPRSLSAALGRPASTIWRVLKRYDCSRAARQPRPPANRYEYAAVGELIHLDIKRLGRFWHVGKRVLADGVHRSEGAGWSYAHVAVDDHSRLGHVQLRGSEGVNDCLAFTATVITDYAGRGTPIKRILTDNGNCYRSRAFAALLRDHDIRHIPYPPLHAPHQRQSRSIHPHPATRIGLRLHLPHQHPQSQSPPRLATQVQQPPTTRRHRRPPPTQPRPKRSEVLHLGGRWHATAHRPVQLRRGLVRVPV